jgi:GNAT superfamily N-acetyltransferase
MVSKLELTDREDVLIRPAGPGDVDVLHQFIIELAEVEQFPEPVTAKRQHLAEVLFGPHPLVEALLATVDEQPVGFSLFYSTYSTVCGRTGIHLEDLYVRREHRGSGLGRALLSNVAKLAIQRNCARLEWWSLRTNEPALQFYRGLCARTVDEITVFRLDGKLLQSVAATAHLSLPSPLAP